MTRKEYEALFASLKTVEACKEAFASALPTIRSNQVYGFYAAFEAAYKRCGNVHADANGKVYKAETLMPPRLYGSLVACVNFACPGVKLSLHGQTLAATGNTYPNREKLRNLGFFWDKKVRVWKYYTCKATFLTKTMPTTSKALAALAD